jgi:hypothetical protein
VTERGPAGRLARPTPSARASLRIMTRPPAGRRCLVTQPRARGGAAKRTFTTSRLRSGAVGTTRYVHATRPKSAVVESSVTEWPSSNEARPTGVLRHPPCPRRRALGPTPMLTIS